MEKLLRTINHAHPVHLIDYQSKTSPRVLTQTSADQNPTVVDTNQMQ